MGKVKSLINITADGFLDGDYVIVDAEYYDFTHNLLSDTDTIAFGRNTFEQFQNRWPLILENEAAPAHQIKMAKALHLKHKIAYSSTLKSTTWNNSSIEHDLDEEKIKSYKQNGRGGMITFGSLSLVSALAEKKLIDDYYFCIQPLIAGKGAIRLFDKIELEKCRPLEYVNSHQLKSGVHIIHYQSVK